MRSLNEFSSVAGSSIERVQDIGVIFASLRLPEEAKKRIEAELKCHEDTLIAAFEFRKSNGPELGPADSQGYFREKLRSMMSFARLVVRHEERDGYSAEKINDNISHYSYLVAKLVAAEWTSKARRPRTDKTIRESSFDNRDALSRLVNR